MKDLHPVYTGCNTILQWRSDGVFGMFPFLLEKKLVLPVLPSFPVHILSLSYDHDLIKETRMRKKKETVE